MERSKRGREGEKEYKTEVNGCYFKMWYKPKNKNVGEEKDSYILIHEYQELLMRGRESLCNF